jgi:hypothetical protein
VVGKNGFVDLSTGTFTADPNGQIPYDETMGGYTTGQTPVLKGDSSGYFDSSYRRWIPAPAEHVLPDGSAYVYEVEIADPHAYEIHLVKVATGADRVVFHMSYDNGYSLIAFRPEGIYLQPILHRSGLPSGIWLFDLLTASLNAVPNSQDGTWLTITNGGAWGGPGGTAGGSLQQLDVRTGSVTTWFTHPVQGAVFEGYGYGVSLLGFDGASHPIVQVFPPGNATPPDQTPGQPEVWLVSSPGQATRLSAIALISDRALSPGMSDAHGLWLVGKDGIYLYNDSRFQRVAPLGSPASPNYSLGGTCV